MLRGLYSAAGGMQAQWNQQDSIAQNLSHAVKPGYRREMVQFASIGQHDDLVAPVSSLHTDFTQGIFEYSGNPLDVALNGPGFFSVQGPTGPLFTRNGAFQVNSLGQLVTQDGLAVQGSAGPVVLPLAPASPIEILQDGSIVADGSVVDRLKVTSFENPEDLQRVGASYFQPLPNSPLSAVPSEVRQRYRELGNTTVVREMVQMIAGARLFDATQRALRQIGETIAYNTRPQ